MKNEIGIIGNGRHSKRIQNILKFKKKKFFVTTKDVYDVISSRTGIPVGNLSESESSLLLNLNKSLNDVVFGQKEVCKSVSDCILR